MIAWIKGVLLEKQAPELVVNVNGVGYQLQAPMTTFYALPDSGEVELFTHFVVREDAQLLFGFASKTERSLFQALIKVNGVGPKLALAILSSIDVQRFVFCVQNDDVNALTKIPGIGKKTAERLLIEMRDRLKDWYIDSDAGASLAADSLQATKPVHHYMTEAESALIALGYKPAEATKMVVAVNNEGIDSAEQLIKAALKAMA